MNVSSLIDCFHKLFVQLIRTLQNMRDNGYDYQYARQKARDGHFCLAQSVKIAWGVELALRRKVTKPIMTGRLSSNRPSVLTSDSNSWANFTCCNDEKCENQRALGFSELQTLRMCSCNPLTPYERITNHILRDRKRRPRGICQCCGSKDTLSLLHERLIPKKFWITNPIVRNLSLFIML